MYVKLAKAQKDFLYPPAVFSLSWIAAIGLACLKLSYLQTDWELLTWLTFYLIYIGFLSGYGFCSRFFPKTQRQMITYTVSATQLKTVIIILSTVMCTAFLAETAILGFIPLFTKDTPHAYSSFHVSGLHYFTVLCVLIPPFFIAFNELNNRKADTVCILCLIISLFLPVLMVSRFQLLFGLLLAAFTFILMNFGKLKTFLRPRTILLFILSLVLILFTYVFITVERAHSISYLNGIFEMKNPAFPIFFTQPYIYITNNFDNFNCLIRDLDEHSCGLKSLFPFFALSGLKFVYPRLVDFPIYTTKEELTTVTMFYDVWYDFGTVGSFLFAIVLGAVFAFLYQRVKNAGRPVFIILYAQMLTYLSLAFFTTWFSNPATWFYLAVTVLIDLILWFTDRKKSEKGISQ